MINGLDLCPRRTRIMKRAKDETRREQEVSSFKKTTARPLGAVPVEYNALWI
jgi:hypothetical protein